MLEWCDRRKAILDRKASHQAGIDVLYSFLAAGENFEMVLTQNEMVAKIVTQTTNVGSKCPVCGGELEHTIRTDYCPKCGYEQGYP